MLQHLVTTNTIAAWHTYKVIEHLISKGCSNYDDESLSVLKSGDKAAKTYTIINRGGNRRNR